MALSDSAKGLLKTCSQLYPLRVQVTQHFKNVCLCGPMRLGNTFSVPDIYLKVSLSLNKSIAMAYMKGFPKW